MYVLGPITDIFSLSTLLYLISVRLSFNLFPHVNPAACVFACILYIRGPS